jgi:hypothetical protein
MSENGKSLEDQEAKDIRRKLVTDEIDEDTARKQTTYLIVDAKEDLDRIRLSMAAATAFQLEPNLTRLGKEHYKATERLVPFLELNNDLGSGPISPSSVKASAPVSETDSPPSRALGRIRWNGTKADFGRVYNILGHLLGCTKADWERHFMGPHGDDMTGAVDNADDRPGRTSELPALKCAAKEMKPIESD